MGVDITERKAQERLWLLESVVVNTNDAIVITEAEPADQPGPRILYANEAFTRMTGYNLEEVIGKNLRLLQEPASDAANSGCEQRATLNKLQACFKRCEPVTVELINYRKDGSEFWVELSLKPVANESGCYTHWIVIQRDITERKRVEQEHYLLLTAEQAARAAAEAANRTKDEFLAIVSHELRSPLNAILGWARLLRTRKFDEATTARALETMERNAQLQTQLIEDLLDISRMIRGQLHLMVSEVNLIAVIHAAFDVVHSSADAKGIELKYDLDPTASLVSGDAVRLQQIIWNLLSNAIKFTPQAGQVEIRLSKVQILENAYAQIQVSDTGMGISTKFLPYVFDRFRQADSTKARSYGGLGLGLAIVRQLVELHGGSVHADSLGEGQGATFTVRLPLLEKSSMTDRSLLSPDSTSAYANCPLPNSLNNLKILVVDDNADAREFVSATLEQYGAEVTPVASVAEALLTLEHLKPDVLVSDIGMPGENGYSLIRKIRQNKTQGGIPAVALTAYAREQDREQALPVGFQMHLRKPVDPLKLAGVVANLARQKK